MKPNDLVTWLNCPSSISEFAESKILAISDCGKFAQLGFIAGWILIEELQLSDCPKSAAFWNLYRPIK